MGRQPCCDKAGVKKGPWTAEEDQKLVSFLRTHHGHCCWRVVPKLAGLLRCGKSCRLRWTNYLRPDLKGGLLSDHEEKLVIDLHAQLGNRWSKIAAHLPGRTDNDIKNRWNTHIRKKLLRMGVDPDTHLLLHQAPVQEQDDPEQKAQPPQPQEQQQQTHNDGDELLQETPAGTQDLPLIPAPLPATATCCGSVISSASAGSASVVSPSCSSSASAAVSGAEATTEWPEPVYLFGMDDGWGGVFPGDGGLLVLDPFLDQQYPVCGFDRSDGCWM